MRTQRRFLSFVLALVFLGAASGEAIAAEQSFGEGSIDVTAGDTTWTGIYDFTWTPSFPFDDPNDFGLFIRDASLHDVTDGYFNAAHMVEVKGSLYDDADDLVDVTDLGDYTALTSSGRFKGAKVTARYDFLENRNVARALFSFKNPGRTTLRLPVRTGTSLAFGIHTEILGTETGEDLVVEEADSWFISCDDDTSPIVIGGMGDTVKLDDAPDNDGEGTDNLWIQRFPLSIKPGKTKRVLVFLEVIDELPSSGLDDMADAYTDGETLERTGLLVGLTDTERKQVVNWDLPPVPIV